MRSVPVFVLFILLLSPLSLAEFDYSIDFHEGNDFGVILSTVQEINPLDYEIKLLLCDEKCSMVEIDSISFNGRETEFFISPEKSGEYRIKLLFEGNETMEFVDDVVINAAHTKKITETEEYGITGNIIKNSTTPFFIAGVLGVFSVILLSFLKTDGRIFFKRWDFKLSSHKIKGFMVFLVSLLVLSQFTHELSHIFAAGFFGCDATLQSFIPLVSPTAVNVNCNASVFQSLAILGSGIIGNIIIGLFFQLFYRRTGKKTLSIISLSFFTSSFVYFFYRTGDIHNIMVILGKSINQAYLDFTGISLLGVTFYLFFIEHIQNMGTNPKYHSDM